jgi:hypothetical protein
MLVSVFLRHYKTYNGIHFIPITIDDDFSVYFGANGIGKSSILEGLDSFFNNRSWNINKFAKSHGFTESNMPYIVPIFLIKKDFLPENNKEERMLKEKANKLSDYFWNIQREDIKGIYEEFTKFFYFRDDILKRKYSQYDYNLLAIGKKPDDLLEMVSFGPFHYQESFLYTIGYDNIDVDSSEKDDFIQRNYFDVLIYIMKQYSYIYIPSDIDVQNYTKLENQDMQKLMHKNVQDEIINAITPNKLEDINQSLKNFIDSITDKLKDYEYRRPTDGTSNILMSDLVTRIIDAYFSIRVLSKKIVDKYIPISELSSGEKRLALVNLAYAFLNEKEKHNKKIILAIDEPEVSLHISACFEQFEKLRKIANNAHQVIITTHWYGFLPIVNSGFAHNVYDEEAKIKFKTYSLEKFQEEITISKKQAKGKLPYDIYLKSTNDLVQSIISSLRAEKYYNYILCEGSSDSTYLKFYLSKYLEKDNLRILPLGGCSEIVKIMKSIALIVSDKNAEIKGTILGLIDTDTQYLDIDVKETNRLLFKRLLFSKSDNDIKLVGPNNHEIIPTQIEHVLDPNVFLETIKTYKNDAVVQIINEIKFNNAAKCSWNIVDFTENDREKVKTFFTQDENHRKVEFAHRYTEIASSKENLNIPTAFKEVIELFDFKEDEIIINIPKELPVYPKGKVVVVKVKPKPKV